MVDPESGLDATRNVGIRADRIVEISDLPLQGEDVVDVSGLVVAPGFIDLHAPGCSLQEVPPTDRIATANAHGSQLSSRVILFGRISASHTADSASEVTVTEYSSRPAEF